MLRGNGLALQTRLTRSDQATSSKCRKRLWRSEVEAARDDDSRAAAQLKKRQERRQPCRCPKYFRKMDP
jgi:hypothetical protein